MKVLAYIFHFLLFVLAYLLFFPLCIINYIVVLFKAKDHAKGYFRSSALNLDRYANRELRTLWNTTLRKPVGYEFGHRDETISSVLGKNKRDNTLSKAGICLAYILDKLDNNHCINSIDDTIIWEVKQN